MNKNIRKAMELLEEAEQELGIISIEYVSNSVYESGFPKMRVHLDYSKFRELFQTYSVESAYSPDGDGAERLFKVVDGVFFMAYRKVTK